MPDRMSERQMECQVVECQNIRQIECQIECQIKCANMSEYMPDRIWNRIRKYYVRVGITRNKATCLFVSGDPQSQKPFRDGLRPGSKSDSRHSKWWNPEKHGANVRKNDSKKGLTQIHGWHHGRKFLQYGWIALVTSQTLEFYTSISKILYFPPWSHGQQTSGGATFVKGLASREQPGGWLPVQLPNLTLCGTRELVIWLFSWLINRNKPVTVFWWICVTMGRLS